MAASSCNQEVVDNRGLERKLEGAGWGLFFLWVGIAIITGMGWGTGLIGVGAIILLGQGARRYFGVKTETFSILLGFFFVLGGIWELFMIQTSLLPVICVIAGLGLLVSQLLSKPHVYGDRISSKEVL
jgi:hypothetical protein